MTENPKILTGSPNQTPDYLNGFLNRSHSVSNLQRLNKRRLLIENKESFYGPESELSIYDTYRSVNRVKLDANQLLYCGMVTGRKIMHSSEAGFSNEQGQIFLPNESFVIPPHGSVEIDFPDACERQPTTCLTIEIPQNRIESVSEQMNDLVTFDGIDYDWQYQPQTIHAHHSLDTQMLIEKMVKLYTANQIDREIKIHWAVSELIVRLLRQQSSERLFSYCKDNPDATWITAVLAYMQNTFSEPLIIEHLCKIACMSRSKLYTEFKKQLGCSPNEHYQRLRLKKAALLLSKGTTVTQACFEVGYKALSHFSRRFFQLYNCSPRQYRDRNHQN